MLITIFKLGAGEEKPIELKSYDLATNQLYDFEEWRNNTEIRRSLSDLLNEIPTLTLTEDAKEESLLEEVKIVLPRSVIKNLERETEQENLLITDFTKQRKNLLIAVFRELSFKYTPVEDYEVKIT